MCHSSMNQDMLKSLPASEDWEAAKLRRQASANATVAAFLKNLSMKQDNSVNFNFGVCCQPSCMARRERAYYRHKYLAMYSPFKTFGKKEDKKPTMKDKIIKWFLKAKDKAKITQRISDESKTTSSHPRFHERAALRLVRFLHSNKVGEKSGKIDL